MSIMKKLGQFGRLVIGADRVALEKTVVESKMTKFGPAVIGTNVKKGTNTPLADSKYTPPMGPGVQVSDTISIPDMEVMLGKNPKYLDHYVEMEATRAGGPRRRALDMLLKVERTHGNRSAMVEKLVVMKESLPELEEETGAVRKKASAKKKKRRNTAVAATPDAKEEEPVSAE
jgi:hypothetical protein